MIVRCEQCGTKYRVPQEKVPEKGIKARCRACGHVMMVTRRGDEEGPPGIDEPLSHQESWKCICGTTNPPEASSCIQCKRSRKLFAPLAVESSSSTETAPPSITPRKPSSKPLISWRSILLVGISAVLVGVGLSYFIGQAVNRSLSAFLTTLFR